MWYLALIEDKKPYDFFRLSRFLCSVIYAFFTSVYNSAFHGKWRKKLPYILSIQVTALLQSNDWPLQIIRKIMFTKQNSDFSSIQYLIFIDKSNFLQIFL